MARPRCLPLLCALLAATLLHAAYAVTPPDPSTCDTSMDVYNLNVNLTTLLDGYEALAMYGTDYGIEGTCLTNALTQLASCQSDLSKISGCCTQNCWDALRMPEIANGCLYSVIRGACNLAAASNSSESSGVVGLLAPLFFTYNNCVNMTRSLPTCVSFGSSAMVGMNHTWNVTYPGNYTIPSYGGVGYGGPASGGVAYGGQYGGVGYGGGLGYGGVGYGSGPGYGGIGYGGYGGVAYGGYGGFVYGGVGYGGIGYGGTGYSPMSHMRKVHRRLAAINGRRGTTSALSSVLRRLKKH